MCTEDVHTVGREICYVAVDLTRGWVLYKMDPSFDVACTIIIPSHKVASILEAGSWASLGLTHRPFVWNGSAGIKLTLWPWWPREPLYLHNSPTAYIPATFRFQCSHDENCIGNVYSRDSTNPPEPCRPTLLISSILCKSCIIINVGVTVYKISFM